MICHGQFWLLPTCLCSVIISAAESLADAQEQETSQWRPTGLMKEGCLGAGLARDDGGSSVQKREPGEEELGSNGGGILGAPFQTNNGS